jgi:hypothetical protein
LHQFWTFQTRFPLASTEFPIFLQHLYIFFHIFMPYHNTLYCFLFH